MLKNIIISVLGFFILVVVFLVVRKHLKGASLKVILNFRGDFILTLSFLSYIQL